MFEAALHSAYLCLKIPATFKVISMFGSQQEAKNIEKSFTPGHKNVHFLWEDPKQHTTSDNKHKIEAPVECKKALKPVGEFKKVPLDPRVPDITVCIDTVASHHEQTELLAFLDKNSDVFTWSTSDLVGVNRDVIEHRLQVSLTAIPKKQKLCMISEEKVEATKVKVQRLLDMGFIREVVYPEWLANVVMVRKKNGKWRMCTDFTDLNKCCTKDDFSLTRIDKIVDSTAGCEVMALLDCFFGYHQIWLRKEDEEKISFITPSGTFCYLIMPEGLHNAGPTFYRMTKAALKEQVGRNVLSYLDDIVVASKKKETYIFDLAETFVNMRKVRLKLNPEKCIFGITKGKVLGYLVSTKGIEANLDKIRVLIQMQPPQSRKDIQKLTCQIASLNRFISKLAERSLPFFTVLRGSEKVDWAVEQQKAFNDLKNYLEHLPTLSSPEQR
jgi:hypothetical protein